MSRFVGTGRRREGGFSALHRQDFNAHTDGSDYRHDSSQIDMSSVLSSTPGATTVQETLEAISNITTSAGSGFISIGNIDGYAQGSYNVGSGNTLAQAFSEAQGDVRLENGGLILVMAGTYRTSTTIQLNPGISVMGEVGGTIIIGEMSEQPIFNIKKSNNLTGIGSYGTQEVLSDEALDRAMFFNMTLSDNLDGYVQSGGLPVSTMQTVPMVQIETGARISFEECRFIGRVHNSGVNPERAKTSCALGTIATTGTGTHLSVRKCYFDAMKIGIDFAPDGGNLDYLIVTQCRARTWGLETTPATTDYAQQCFIAMSLCNFTITDNIHSGIQVPGWGTDGTGTLVCDPVCSFGFFCNNGVCVAVPD